MFATRRAFDQAGGFPDIPLIEDVALSSASSASAARSACRARVVTSGRRWDERGVLRTMLLMWRLGFAMSSATSPRHSPRAMAIPRDGSTPTAIAILAKAPIVGGQSRLISALGAEARHCSPRA